MHAHIDVLGVLVRAVNGIFIVRIITNPIRGLKYTSPSTTYFKGGSQLARTAENELFKVRSFFALLVP